jgi:hypothetical protein
MHRESPFEMKTFSKFLYVAFNGRLDIAGSAESVMMVTFGCQLGCLSSLVIHFCVFFFVVAGIKQA